MVEKTEIHSSLDSSDGRYRRLFESMADPVFVVDQESGQILEVSPVTARTYGYASGELTGLNVAVVSADPENTVRAVRAGAQVMGHRVHQRKDGTQFPVEVSSTVIDWDGRKALVGIVRDISDRERAEEALRGSEERFRNLMEWMPEATVIHRGGRILQVNPAAVALFGASSALNLIGKPVLDLTHPSSRQSVMERVKATVDRGIAQRPLEQRFMQLDGTAFDAEVGGVPITYDGTPAILAVIRDITERKRGETAVRQSKARFEELFQQAPLGIALINSLTGHFYEVNPMFARISGRTLQELITTNWMKITHPDDIQGDLDHMARLNSGATDGFQMEKRYLHPDGAVVWINMTIARAKAGDDGPRHLCMIEDISERKRKETERLKLEDQLHQSQKMESVGRLAGGVAHDFNNMLTVILGNTELALGQVAPALPLHADLEEIRSAALRSSDLTRQLLAFARRQTIAPRVLNLNEALAGMRKLLERLIGENVVLSFLSSPGLWPVKVDPSQLDQLLANLCVNARDAIADVGKLTIEMGNSSIDDDYCAEHADVIPGDYVRLVVSDNGRGMDKETLSHLFEPFFTTKPLGEGTGLGLATVFGIVKQNGGFINVYSEPGQGTTFTVYLPRHLGEIQLAGTPAVSTARGGHETILVVEDEEAILKATRRMLERSGYTVLTASTPGEALRLATELPGKLHLLMTDVVMPEMNGRDLAAKLSAICPGLKCLFMSGYTANVIALHGVLKEGIHFVQKPFSGEELATRVRAAIDG